MKYLLILVLFVGMMGASCEESPNTRPLPNSISSIKYTVHSNGTVFKHLHYINSRYRSSYMIEKFITDDGRNISFYGNFVVEEE